MRSTQSDARTIRKNQEPLSVRTKASILCNIVQRSDNKVTVCVTISIHVGTAVIKFDWPYITRMKIGFISLQRRSKYTQSNSLKHFLHGKELKVQLALSILTITRACATWVYYRKQKCTCAGGTVPYALIDIILHMMPGAFFRIVTEMRRSLECPVVLTECSVWKMCSFSNASSLLCKKPWNFVDQAESLTWSKNSSFAFWRFVEASRRNAPFVQSLLYGQYVFYA